MESIIVHIYGLIRNGGGGGGGGADLSRVIKINVRCGFFTSKKNFPKDLTVGLLKMSLTIDTGRRIDKAYLGGQELENDRSLESYGITIYFNIKV